MRIISRDGLPWVVHSRAGISVGFNTIAVLTAPVSPHEREVCCLSVPEVSRIDQSVAHREVYLPRATCSRHLGELVERSWGGAPGEMRGPRMETAIHLQAPTSALAPTSLLVCPVCNSQKKKWRPHPHSSPTPLGPERLNGKKVMGPHSIDSDGQN
jgi:hypothetical protein